MPGKRFCKFSSKNTLKESKLSEHTISTFIRVAISKKKEDMLLPKGGHGHMLPIYHTHSAFINNTK